MEEEITYAGFWRRLAAGIIDIIIVGIGAGAILMRLVRVSPQVVNYAGVIVGIIGIVYCIVFWTFGVRRRAR